jgi:cytochrome P450
MLDDNQKGLSTGFSSGQRACIGKRFAEVEMVAFITHMVKEYKFEPVPLEGEGMAEMETRYLEGKEVLNLTPAKWDLKMTRRT